MGIMHISGHAHQIQQKEMSKFFDYKYSKKLQPFTLVIFTMLHSKLAGVTSVSPAPLQDRAWWWPCCSLRPQSYSNKCRAFGVYP